MNMIGLVTPSSAVAVATYERKCPAQVRMIVPTFSPLRQYLYDLDRRLDRIMAAVPAGEAGRKLHKRMLANRAHLFVFMTNRAVPYTNNISERHLRPSVIFRKVTNGFRCEWGAETYAAFRSVVSTAKANSASVLNTIRFVLSSQTARQAPISPG